MEDSLTGVVDVPLDVRTGRAFPPARFHPCSITAISQLHEREPHCPSNQQRSGAAYEPAFPRTGGLTLTVRRSRARAASSRRRRRQVLVERRMHMQPGFKQLATGIRVVRNENVAKIQDLPAIARKVCGLALDRLLSGVEAQCLRVLVIPIDLDDQSVALSRRHDEIGSIALPAGSLNRHLRANSTGTKRWDGLQHDAREHDLVCGTTLDFDLVKKVQPLVDPPADGAPSEFPAARPELCQLARKRPDRKTVLQFGVFERWAPRTLVVPVSLGRYPDRRHPHIVHQGCPAISLCRPRFCRPRGLPSRS